MKHFALAVAIAAALPGMAAAQAVADPADPLPPVPAPAYRSVFQDLPSGVEQEQLDWKKANADVAQFARGHADYVKWEEQQQAGGKQPSGAGAPAAPPATTAPPAGQPGHRHH